ncbi:hypothetical protein FIBSPDRAFT_729779 [Athelia psychrophila]|uniref:hAT-like transposase RNase-H fold domain-containing protein n=1 Tax=Athelia psychrophila TaxID=1759441 RepID=A0A166RD53_9AGAM|nr:hypothetical protein FIBSPDRAFT_729779 [Fibularhizoctonia sp. CBS 109695]
MERYGLAFHSDNARIRCLVHIVNIVVQTLLKELDEAEVPDINNYFNMMKSLPVHYNPNNDEDLQEMEGEDFADLDSAEIKEMLDQELGDVPKSAVKKASCQSVCQGAVHPRWARGQGSASDIGAVQVLRIIVNKIVSSPQCRKYFRKCTVQFYAGKKNEKGTRIEILMVIRDVRTRWNYTHAMIKRALLLRKVWCLKVFTSVTFKMSRAGTPTLPWAILCYHLMQNALAANCTDEKLRPSLQQAAKAGLNHLNHYYKIALSNHYNIIATILHPHLRLGYFKNLGKDEHTRAEIIFKTVYEQYENEATTCSTVPESSPLALASSSSSFLSQLSLFEVDKGDYAIGQQKSELDRYLLIGQGGRGHADAPLHWWKVCHHSLILSRKCAHLSCSYISTSSPFSQRWLVIFLPSQVPVFLWSAFSQNPATSALTFEVPCVLQRSLKLCACGNGFATISWPSSRPFYLHLSNYRLL